MLKRLVNLIISLLVFSLMVLIAAIRRIVGVDLSGKLVVVTYHAVKSHQRIEFVKQMDQILKIGKPVFADIAQPLEQKTHHIAVTFDDAFQCILDHALPATYERKIPVTIFVPAGYLGKLPGWIKDTKDNAKEEVMTADQISKLPHDKVKIGSHTLTHPLLTKLSPDHVHHELIESKLRLGKITNTDVILLAFPYNDYNDTIVEIARMTGYRRVFSNVPTYPISRMDGFILGRIDVTPNDWRLEFLLKLKGAYQWLPFAIKMKRAMKRMIA